MIYATKDDLALWLGVNVSDLPGNADRMLKNASRVIDHATLGQIKTNDQNHLEVAKNATTAQCEYWIDGMDESIDIHPNMKSYNAGKTSFEFTNGIPKLAPRARRELWLGGLYNRRVINA